MFLLGMTGSIGMGKSVAAGFFRLNGVPVFDADQAVHSLYEGAAVPLIERAFPETTASGKVDRIKLSEALREAPEKFAILEGIVHPLVRAEEADFLAIHAERYVPLVVLDIPLLYETKFDLLVDAVVVVSATAEQQRERVLARPGMTEAKLQQILSRQMPDAEKRVRADYLVDTSGTIASTEAQIDKLVVLLRGRAGQAFQRHWQ